LEDKTISSLLNSKIEQETVLQISGKASLSGEVTISGAKNSALAIMAGALLCSDYCRLTNVPNLVDIDSMGQVLASLGVKITKNGHILDINTQNLQQYDAPYDLVSQLRASFFVIGPLLTRLGIARIPLPGGCAIGARPVDIHVRGLKAMGAEVSIEHGVVHAHVKNNKKRLTGARIYLDYPSVGATETLMMAATLAEGETILENAAQEPEVVDLANFCRAMGAQIKGAGSQTIMITGVPSLQAVEYEIIPDRIEAGTFLIAGAITQSEISLFPVITDHLNAVIAKLRDMGAQIIKENSRRLRFIPSVLRPIDIETMPYPGFPTDMQAQFMALLSITKGNSLITETVFENRFGHVAELNRMGANIRVKGNHVFISGVSQLSGAPVMATDLRASASLVLAGLASEGTTIMQGLHHLDRGYDNLEGKLRALGADINRVTL